MKARILILLLVGVVPLVLFSPLWASAQDYKCGYTGAETSVTLDPGIYTITAFGAAGGTGTSAGGMGAEIQAQFTFLSSETLTILVGGMGSGNFYGGAGGGGGSFVVNASDTPLVVAGGGGGGGLDGGILTGGTSGIWGSSGGQNGSGGGGGTYNGAGGGGFYSNGEDNLYTGSGGGSFLSGGAGGASENVNGTVGNGGFGGGGAGVVGLGFPSLFGEGGGGGGYSGGGGGGSNRSLGAHGGGGGGGSYVDASGIPLLELPGAQFGNGLVEIQLVPEPSANLLAGVGGLLCLGVRLLRRTARR